jgi:hypothetical protein
MPLACESLESRHLMTNYVINFGELSLQPGSHWNGPDPTGTDQPDPYGGTWRVGSFQSGGASFSNNYESSFWQGFGYSNEKDTTTAGIGNQFSSFAGSGQADIRFGIGTGYLDSATFDPTDVAQLSQLPTITFPPNATISSAYFTNTTYAGISMRDGDSFAKKFGGPTGDDPDYFRVNVYGTDASGNVLPGSAQLYLADYRFTDNTQDYILNTWTQLNLSALSTAHKLYFNLDSSDVGTFGMNTPAYFAIDSIAYSAPNTAPVIDTSLTPQLKTQQEDDLSPTGTLVSEILSGSITDPDFGAKQGMAVVAAPNVNGQWQYSLNNGASWLNLNNASESAARLLPADASTRLRFKPDPDFSGDLTIDYRAWDQTQGIVGSTMSTSGKTGGTNSLSTDVETASLKIAAVNDSPVLDTSTNPTFPTILEDATSPAGMKVSDFANSLITDVDPDAVKGIGVTAAPTANGLWYYTLNGTTWKLMGAVKESNTRLLPADANTRIRFIPKKDFNGQMTLIFRAWDQTDGVAGDTLDTAGRTGDTKCFSLEYESISITVTPVNDAPVLTTTPIPSLGTIQEDAKSPVGTLLKYFATSPITDVDAGALKGIAVIGAPETNGAWQFTLDGTVWQSLGPVSTSSARLLPVDNTTKVRFIPSLNYNGLAWMTYRAWDRTDGVGGNLYVTSGNVGLTGSLSSAQVSAKLTITPVNDKPSLVLSGTIGYIHNHAPIVLAPNAGVTDVDSPDFGGGQLKIRFDSSGVISGTNFLSIGAGFSVDDAYKVYQGNLIIGTLNPGGGEGTTDLVVSFNTSATPAIVQALVRSITFKTVGSNVPLGMRVAKFTVSDGDGGVSAEATKNINVT